MENSENSEFWIGNAGVGIMATGNKAVHKQVIFVPSHAPQPEVPTEIILTLCEAIRNHYEQELGAHRAPLKLQADTDWK